VELVEPVEQSMPEVLEASGPVPPTAVEDEAGTAAVAAGTTGSASTAAAAAGTGTEVECCCQTQQEPSSSSCPQSLGACARC
jgi:hypothetical protein